MTKPKRCRTKIDGRTVDMNITFCGDIAMEVADMDSGRVAYLTPAQARRIAAHLVKLAEMREGEKRA